MAAKYNKGNLFKMNLLWGKSYKGNPRGHSPILFFDGRKKEPSLAMNIKDGTYEIQVGLWSWKVLYNNDTYIVLPKELA